ncbi:MAG: hypothetical protein Kow0092_13980 [Deferrisomatales bacterium]
MTRSGRPMDPPEETALPVMDWDEAETRAGGDRAFVRELVTALVEDLPEYLAALRTAAEPAAQARAAHRIRGAAANVGAKALARAAQRAEARPCPDTVAQVEAEAQRFLKEVDYEALP